MNCTHRGGEGGEHLAETQKEEEEIIQRAPTAIFRVLLHRQIRLADKEPELVLAYRRPRGN